VDDLLKYTSHSLNLEVGDLFRSIVNTAYEYVYFKNRESEFVYANDALRKSFGVCDEEGVIGKTDFDFYPKAFAAMTFKQEQAVMDTRVPMIEQEERLVTPDGKVLWYMASKYPLIDKNDIVVGMWGLSAKINKQKNIEFELESLNEQLEEALRVSKAMEAEAKRLYSMALDANPITRLPGNNSIHKHIDQLIKSKAHKHVLYCDIDYFKSYNDKYGFANGDKVILATAELMQETAQQIGAQDVFVGHIGGDDFVVSIDSSFALRYAERLLDLFDDMIWQQYKQKDIKIGYIKAETRSGKMMRFPICSLSIGGVALEENAYENYLMVSDACSMLKTVAKKRTGSSYLFERRK